MNTKKNRNLFPIECLEIKHISRQIQKQNGQNTKMSRIRKDQHLITQVALSQFHLRGKVITLLEIIHLQENLKNHRFKMIKIESFCDTNEILPSLSE